MMHAAGRRTRHPESASFSFQTVDKERYKDAVLRQREVESKMLDGRLHTELERQRRDLTLQHR